MNRSKLNWSRDKLRRGLKATDDLELPMAEEYFNSLHDKIMKGIEQTEVAPVNLLRSHWRGWLYAVRYNRLKLMRKNL